MTSEFTTWLETELKRRKWSHRELARRMDMSHSFVSKIVGGKVSPSVNFCHKLATALDIPPAQVLQIVGILPNSEPAPTNPSPLTVEIMQIAETLTGEQKALLLDFARLLARRDEGE